MPQVQVPDTMTYDGELRDHKGEAVSATVEASFRIYDAETEGTEAWSEPAAMIEVVNGRFSHRLGTEISLGHVFDGKAYWLEVSLDGAPLVPRTPIASIPYAFRANSAANADTIGAKRQKTYSPRQKQKCPRLQMI